MDDFGRLNQTVTLRDGRKLGLADYGPQSGTPVIGRYLADAIPDCQATFVPGAGHMLFYTRFGLILRQVVQHG